jgi:hypothetical protein
MIGISAERAQVIVHNNVVGRYQDLRLEIPATTCSSIAKSVEGVFFKSDKQVFFQSWVAVTPG